MKPKIPKTIYLQLDEEGEPDTWSREQINSDDVVYVKPTKGETMNLTDREQEIKTAVNNDNLNIGELRRKINKLLPAEPTPPEINDIVIVNHNNHKTVGYFAGIILDDFTISETKDGSNGSFHAYCDNFTWHYPETDPTASYESLHTYMDKLEADKLEEQVREYKYNHAYIAWAEYETKRDPYQDFKAGFNLARETTTDPVKISAEVQETADIIDKATKPEPKEFKSNLGWDKPVTQMFNEETEKVLQDMSDDKFDEVLNLIHDNPVKQQSSKQDYEKELIEGMPCLCRYTEHPSWFLTTWEVAKKANSCEYTPFNRDLIGKVEG